MLAMARILRTGAKLLLLDEITEGPGAGHRAEAGRSDPQLRERGFTIVMVEQNFRFAAPLADRFYVMEHGEHRRHDSQGGRTAAQDGHAARVPRRLSRLGPTSFHRFSSNLNQET
jgi:branched-chain amino acid transport system ATP-binding protein